MDYFDILLAKKLSGGGGGDITVEGLTVNDNGTYTAPSGKAYSPVVVNLPLDEKTITANGEYLASADDLKGYSKVTVAVEGFKVKDMPTGAISSFDDGTENPLKELKVSIVPIQSGSGDPSPTNPRPISGWSSVGVTVAGANVWDEQTEGGTYNNTTGEPQNSSTLTRCKNFIKVNPSESYYLVIGSTSALNILQYGENKEYLGSSALIQNIASREFSVTANTYYIRFYFVGTTYNNDISINYPSTDTTYHAYNGTTTTIPLGQTVYGGELDVTSGILKARPYYASYNGEPLVGPWISSLDEYEEGATPTTGAQVVDLGGTETTYQLTPTQVSSILGTNNLWADSGQVLEGEYFISL